jgi:hypothetical protein
MGNRPQGVTRKVEEDGDDDDDDDDKILILADEFDRRVSPFVRRTCTAVA